jgi:pyruvate dehydrogenase E2 component (dihydrolipoamide acetyltransferase)
MGLRTFSSRMKDLITQGREGTLGQELPQDATFTITNLGAYGIESFTPILNSPQVAMLGINAITRAPVIQADSTLGHAQKISFSLTVDHGVIDGGEAARYLASLAGYIANIDLAILAEGAPHG